MKENQVKFGDDRLFGMPYHLWKKYRVAILSRLNNPYKKSMPVFLIGCGRSGTNMLTKGLAKSFQIKLYNENHPAAFEDFRVKDFTAIEQLNKTGYIWIKLYKPILDTHLARKYLSHFQNAKIIFIFRHYDDVINSSIKLFGPDNWPTRVKNWITNDFAEFASASPPDITKEYIQNRWHKNLSSPNAIALYWLFYNRLYFDLGLNHNERVILIRYEDIVTKPNIEFHKLCKFLGIKYSDDMIEGIFSSSIKRNTSPEIEPSLRKDCDHLLEKLCEMC